MSNAAQEWREKLVPYLDGELAGAELAGMEKQLATDAALQEELHNLRLAREAIRYYGLQQQVRSVHSEMMKEMQAPVRPISATRRMIRYSLSVAAGVLLLFLGIAGYNFYQLSPGKVFARYYRSYELGTVRGKETETAVTRAYREKNYAQVIILAANSTDITEIFLAAMSYAEIQNYPAAIGKYKEVISRNDSNHTTLLKDDAEYYLALAYIAQKEYAAALPLLRQIKNDPFHLYHEKVSGGLIRKVRLLEWK